MGIFVSTYLLAALTRLLLDPNPEFAFYLVVTLLLAGLVLWLHRQMELNLYSLWGLAVWGMLHMAGGLVRVPESWSTTEDANVLYNLWFIPGSLKYDQVVHAYGFGLVTWIAWQGLQHAFAKRGVQAAPTWGLLLICICTGLGAGALNEVVEFAAFQTLPETNVGNYQNTGWDLVANMVGCLVAACWIHWLVRTGDR